MASTVTASSFPKNSTIFAYKTDLSTVYEKNLDSSVSQYSFADFCKAVMTDDHTDVFKFDEGVREFMSSMASDRTHRTKFHWEDRGQFRERLHEKISAVRDAHIF